MKTMIFAMSVHTVHFTAGCADFGDDGRVLVVVAELLRAFDDLTSDFHRHIDSRYLSLRK